MTIKAWIYHNALTLLFWFRLKFYGYNNKIANERLLANIILTKTNSHKDMIVNANMIGFIQNQNLVFVFDSYERISFNLIFPIFIPNLKFSIRSSVVSGHKKYPRNAMDKLELKCIFQHMLGKWMGNEMKFW